MSSTHTYFCCESDCGAEAPVYGGRCYLCSCAKKWREASEGLHTCEKRGKESCIPCAFYAPITEHKCSGELDYELGYIICDNADSPQCPQYRVQTKHCADCGFVPENGHFPCYRGSDPLCADCEEAAYGPPSPVDWRERTGRCSKCDFFYDLISSSDRRDLCYKCQ